MTKLCRLCLKPVDNFKHIVIKNEQIYSKTVIDKLYTCIPEMDLSLVKESLMCNSCAKNLNSFYCFKKSCLKSEKQICNYLKKINTTEALQDLNANQFGQHSTLLNQKIKTGCETYTSTSPIKETIVKENDTNETNFCSNSNLENEFQDIGTIKQECNVKVETEDITESLEQINTTEALQDFNVNQHHSSSILVNQKIKTESETYTSNNANKETIVEENYTDKSNFCSNSIVNLENEFQDINVIKQELSIKVENDDITEIEENVDFEKKESSPLDYFDQENVNSVTEYPIVLTENDNTYNENVVDMKYLAENPFVSTMGIQDFTQTDNTTFFNCINCSFSCLSANDLKRHLLVHKKPKVFNCEVCDYVSTSKSHMNNHVTIHTGDKRYKCQQCDYKSAQNSHLRRHLRIHTGDKPYRCDQCDYRSGDRSTLVKHLVTHSGKEPLQCEFCSYKTLDKSLLNRHHKIHSGEKPFKCEHCDYRTSQKSSLLKHFAIHTGMKPFKCDMCEYRCVDRAALKPHYRIHTGEKPFHCKECDYKSTKKSNLMKHMATHTGEKPYQCGHCDYRSSDAAHVRRHLKVHNKEIAVKSEIKSE